MALFESRGFTLAPWQNDAVAAWMRGDGSGSYRGTLEIFTGGGKTLLALQCAANVAKLTDGFRVIVIVPTVALAQQWEDAVLRFTTIDPSRVHRIAGPTTKAKIAAARVAILVINTAAKRYEELSFPHGTMLIVDECHRAGAPLFRNALKIAADYRLGLSATPEREELDESGEALKYDEQIVAKRLGSVVYAFDLGDARRAGWLPEYAIVHHGIELEPKERAEYETRSRRVDEAADRLRTFGSDPGRARLFQARKGEAGDAARSYLAAVSSRKDVVYRANERTRIACKLAVEALADPGARVLLFNERIDAVETLGNSLRAIVDDGIVATEHSERNKTDRQAALDGFRNGSIRALVSAKSLIEGIDVPEANVGISVASTGSVRQRIQALGRVLRLDRSESKTKKLATMHVIYVASTVDESIYEKEDWVDLTGESRNEFLRWPLDPNVAPTRADGPPRRPKSTEMQEFARLSALGASYPQPWLGVLRGQDYRIDTRGNLMNASNTMIENVQGVGEMIRAVRGTSGGKFIVTPVHRFVLVAMRVDDVTKWFVGGIVPDEFRPITDVDRTTDVDVSASKPGDPYFGPVSVTNGKYMVRARHGGVVERARGRIREFARSLDGDEPGSRNLMRLLAAWRATENSGMEFYLNDLWDAWYRDGGVAKFLVRIEGGFNWDFASDAETAATGR